MWTISELKNKGKIMYKANYWSCSLIGFFMIGTIFATIGAIATSVRTINAYRAAGVLEGVPHLTSVFILLSLLLTVLIISFAIKNLVLSPLQVGCNHFYSENTKSLSSFDTLTTAYNKENYWRVFKNMFFRELFQLLWALFLLVPGIMKYYEYRMIPYLLIDEPELSRKELFEKSKTMMEGHKLNAFLLDLSFIGYDILSICTLGIFGVFYAIPYKEATRAELYQALLPKEKKKSKSKRNKRK